MRPNQYDGACRSCGVAVKASEGQIKLDPTTDKWITYHKDGACPEASSTTRQNTVGAGDSAVDKVISLMTAKFTDLVPELVALNLAKLSRVAEIKVGKAPSVKLETAHMMLPDIVMACVAGVSPFLVGPAGSGKTTLAEQVATVLKLKFYMAARVTSEFKLMGFRTATGETVRTQFREAFEHGGVFLFDEVDASDADALTSFNAALANGLGDFPDGMIKRHKNFVAIAAGNTFGRGADRQYVGRNQLDAATLDRFQTFEVDYDEMLELELSGDVEWARYVQKVRAAIEAEKVRHIVSPRASIQGAKLLAHGMERDKVEEACIWKGLDSASRARVGARLGR
jgi:energy-coupling factor transporter ATP-binding protein EcfA2